MARRKTEVFGLSFMDCICCGFGATILLFMILNSGASKRADEELGPLRAETDRLEQQVLEGQANLVELRNTLEQVRQQSATAQGLSTRLIDVVKQSQEELATFERQTIAQREHLNKLQADLRSLEEGAKRLSGGIKSREVPGDKVRSFVGDGDRQYLTGLKVGGKRILFLVDASASMLADTIVNAVRRRLLPAADRVRADKWRKAVRSADWLTTQIPRDAQFQIYVFNTEARPVLPGTDGAWLEARDGTSLDQAVAKLRGTAPEGGTSLETAFAAAAAHAARRPTTSSLLTDGLPTQGRTPPPGRIVSRARSASSSSSARCRRCPRGVPVNILLFPMEGDPMAAPAFWKLAIATRGSFITPSRTGREAPAAPRHRALQPVVPRLHLLRLRGHHPAPHPHPHERAPGHRGGARGPGRRIARLEQEIFEIRGETDDPEPRAGGQTRAALRGQGGGGPAAGRPREAARAVQGQPRAVAGAGHHGGPHPRRPAAAHGRDEAAPGGERAPGAGAQELVGGIPVDSEYVIFVIDTSGSMQRYAWPAPPAQDGRRPSTPIRRSRECR